MTTTLPLDAITHPASKRLFKISDLTRAQKGALQTFVAADSNVLRATGIVSNVIHDSLTVEVFESLPDIRYHYIHPYVMAGTSALSPLVMDVSRYGAYLMVLTGQIDREERSEFEVIVRELFHPHHKFFWPLLNSWCEVLIELGLTRRLTRELYLHDVLEEHKIEFSDKDALTPAAKRFLEAVRFVRGDIAVAILGIEYEVLQKSGGKPAATAPVHLRKQPRERFASRRLGERELFVLVAERSSKDLKWKPFERFGHIFRTAQHGTG